jgi:uncharacterized membrane protein YidH (DUF202 family)
MDEASPTLLLILAGALAGYFALLGWLWSFRAILSRHHLTTPQKVLWCLVSLCLPVVGALIYAQVTDHQRHRRKH